jgi:hypothetical protein
VASSKDMLSIPRPGNGIMAVERTLSVPTPSNRYITPSVPSRSAQHARCLPFANPPWVEYVECFVLNILQVHATVPLPCSHPSPKDPNLCLWNGVGAGEPWPIQDFKLGCPSTTAFTSSNLPPPVLPFHSPQAHFSTLHATSLLPPIVA